MSARLMLFDVDSTDDLGRRLQEWAGQCGATFSGPRVFGPSCPSPSLEPSPAAPTVSHSAEHGAANADQERAGSAAACQTSGHAGGDSGPSAAKQPPVPVWMWAGSGADLRACAGRVLNHFVYPLAADGRSFCVAFPFGADELAPRRLDVARRHQLDLEDIAALLGAAAAPSLRPSSVALAALEGLDADQHAAACHGGGPARVLAAAGSGKTKTMVARIAALVARGTPPQSILVLAFNAEAALQLEERLAAAGVPTTRRIEKDAGGVHCSTFNAFGYRFQQSVLGGAPAVSADGAAEERLLRRVLAEGGSDADRDPYDAGLSDAAGRLAGTLCSWRAELVIPPAGAAAAVSRYGRLQAAQGGQTFDDQVIATVCALLADPAHRQLLQGIYRYVLVDEFQDVNPAQQALLDILSRPWRNLFVVGDDDQLIYGWRSAHVGSIIDFGAELPPAPHSAYYTLPTNYRCSHEVVGRAEQLVVNNRRRAGKSMRARPSAPPGAVLFAGAAGPQDRCLEIAAFLAVERLRLGCPWSEVAVLARYRAQLEAVRGGLRHHEIPVGAPPAAVGLHPAWAAQLDRRLHAALRDERVRSLTAAAALEEIAAATGHTADEAAHDVLDAARLLACDHATPAGLAAAWRRLTGTTATSSGPWSGGKPPGEAHERKDGVTLATIHSTKGCEYRSVVVVDFAPALEPLSPQELEEERRVLYVALTRAKHAALLTVAAGAQGPHPFLRELSRPPQRTESRALRRELAALRTQLGTRRHELPPAMTTLLEDHLLDDGPSATSPSRSDLGERCTRFLELRSRLLERRLFAPRSAAIRLLAARR